MRKAPDATQGQPRARDPGQNPGQDQGHEPAAPNGRAPPLKSLFAMPAHDRAMVNPRNVIIEFYPVGAYVKVSAIDPVTLTEVSIVGDPQAGEARLKREAVRRLEYVLARKPAAPAAGRR